MIEFETPPAGIYFGMPEDEYHAIPALGSTNIKDILCHPVVFYARSWMNTLTLEEQEEEKSEAKTTGDAFHARILEGYDVFYSQFAASFDPSNYPDAYDSTDEIKTRLRQLKEEGNDWIRLTGNKPFLVEQLLKADPEAEVMDGLRYVYEQQFDGMTFLPQSLIDRIEYSAAMIEKHPQLSKCFKGGYPEVTIIWQHPEFPWVMMKARIDYLKLRSFIDLKTFGNKFGKPIDLAIYGAMASYKYAIQGAHYWDGISHAIKFAQRGQVNGEHDPEWIKKFGEAEDLDLYYVFQQTGIAPLARGKKFPKSGMYQCAVVGIQNAIDLYNDYLKRFGTEQWVDTSPITDFHDDEFPVYATEF